MSAAGATPSQEAIERLARAIETLTAQLAKPRRRAPPWRVQMARDIAALHSSLSETV
jgi:hypothetical protein